MKNSYLLLAFTLLIGCSDEPTFKPIGVEQTEATHFQPLALENEWTYLKTDSTSTTAVDSSEFMERVDSCCYYIGRYSIKDMKHLGWKWRSGSLDDMYSNGNSKIFSTSCIDKEKGTWYRLDSGISGGNISLIDIAGGKYSVSTVAGTFNCIKARLSLANCDQNSKSIYYRYYGEKVGLVKERIETWSGQGNNAVIIKSITHELINYSLN